ncbi:GNAT family N-acetyltransferase [Rossellomorea vietnamensis]|uniref:GNAT family N-acetyltransferase n=1 Tax=Rossellomorea vietnamensis TaxID=218284 RepID=A0A5D4MIF0_9BACI|nr:GNAT family N-acetyltransferase [Rossellomorea vietnamensis]TYS01442.1 GNAT family N-acetyltransferase [Rossellomorea vietnamensis]
MNIKIHSCEEKEIKACDIALLYKHAGWWDKRDKRDIEKMLKKQISVGAWNGNTLIGFARAVTDGVFRAYLEDVILHKEWRKSGIGTRMVSSLLDELVHIDIVSLFCEEEHIPFYEKSGFKKSRSQFIMHRKKGM